MTTVIHDTLTAERLKAERAMSGADRHDEVWENVYMMAPMPNHEHQLLVFEVHHAATGKSWRF